MDHKKTANIKLFLDSKLKDCEIKIRKMRRKRKIIKIIYGATIVISVSVSTLAVTVSGFLVYHCYRRLLLHRYPLWGRYRQQFRPNLI